MIKVTKCLVKRKSCLPIWFMRQAGRYLPEFRALRSKNKNFVKLCLNSKLSSEITLQPIRRFDLDAAIIFSDILIVPYAMGQQVKFLKKQGPKLSKIRFKNFLKVKEKEFTKILSPIYKAIKITRKKLHKDKSLICFVGAPWTLIVYMLGLKNSNNKLNKGLFNKKKEEIKIMIEILNKFLAQHIDNQIKAGADTVQIFDSWSGIIPKKNLEELCFNPNKKLVDFCKMRGIPVICFPKGIKYKYSDFLKKVKPDCLSIDYSLNLNWAKKNLKNVCIQGGMSPKILLKKDKFIYKEASRYLTSFKNHPYIFNLGHGLLPQTDPDKLKKLIKFVRNFK